MTVEVSKIDAARRQLLAAIRLYFLNGDAVAIHTLTAAALNVLVDLSKHRGVDHPLSMRSIVETIRPELRQGFWNKLRAAERFFKHADKDPDGVLAFDTESTEFLLLQAVASHHALTDEPVPEFYVYKMFILRRLDFLADPEAYCEESRGTVYAPEQRMDFIRDTLIGLAGPKR